MKYVFYDVFWSASAPKAGLEIIDILKRASGSEMLKGYLPKFLDMLKRKIDEANNSGRHAKFELYHHQGVHYTDHKVHGQIAIHQDAQFGKKDIARLHYIELNSMWAENFASGGELKQWDIAEWEKKRVILEDEDYQAKMEAATNEQDEIIEKMVGELKNGAPVEEVIDKYVTCATPELRGKLIDGMKAIVEEGGES